MAVRTPSLVVRELETVLTCGGNAMVKAFTLREQGRDPGGGAALAGARP